MCSRACRRRLWATLAIPWIIIFFSKLPVQESLRHLGTHRFHVLMSQLFCRQDDKLRAWKNSTAGLHLVKLNFCWIPLWGERVFAWCPQNGNSDKKEKPFTLQTSDSKFINSYKYLKDLSGHRGTWKGSPQTNIKTNEAVSTCPRTCPWCLVPMGPSPLLLILHHTQV